MKTLPKLWLIFLFIWVVSACNKEDTDKQTALNEILVPSSFSEIPFPSDNHFTAERWLLGKKLFYDKRLSIDSTLSCASCHKLEFSFSDNVSTTNGVKSRSGTRNVPSLANVAYNPYYTREGGVPTLEMQVLVPISEHNEFAFNLVEIVDRLKNDPEYKSMSKVSYQRELDAFTITRAISNFERSMISGNSKYDKYLKGKVKLTTSELLGKDLFFSDKTHCSKCHSGFNFTNYEFKNNGLYNEYNDEGRYRLTQLESDRAVFKTPSLRNISFTAPYMHDGSIATIDEVLMHYNNGIKNHPNKSELLKPMNLSLEELTSLKAFLKCLDDYEFVSNKVFLNQ